MVMDALDEVAEMFKALSDGTRLRLVRLLSEHQGALCVNALAHHLGVTQSAVSQHLRVLRQAGLVRGERQGPRVHYVLQRDGLERLRGALQQVLDEESAAG
jgi:ArsR family transcriptional regulator